MNKHLPFFVAIVVFILVWGALLQMPHIKSVSSNNAIVYSTISLYVGIIVFVILASIYRIENMKKERECLKDEFIISFDDIFH